MNRAAWIGLVIAAFLFLSGAATAAPPNVLIIVADDHAPYVIGDYGNTVVRTPRIDRLAAEGIRFDRAFCNSPVCTASRQSFLTGRYPRTIGVTQLSTPLPESEITLADLLAAQGYDTAAIGKMHFNSPLKHGFDRRIDLPDHARFLAERGARPVLSELAVLPPWRPFASPAAEWLNSDARPFGAFYGDMPGTWFAARAAEWLADRGARPFFLMVSFTEPHSPFHFPIEFAGRHAASEFTAPEPGPEDDEQIPAIFRKLTPAQKQGIAAAYYTSVEFLDTNVGRVLDALEHSGRASDTLVVYLGDHGYLLGQHGRFEKHCSFEEAIRVPLVMRFPKRIQPGTSTEALVELVDLAPTVLEFCGVDPPDVMQGKGLSALASGRATEHRPHVVVEYAPNDEILIRDDRWKLIFERGERKREDGYDPGRPLAGRKLRLYNLENDPAELKNVAESAPNTPQVERLTTLLIDHLRATAREPEATPNTTNPLDLLDHLVQPRDVEKDE